MRPQPVPRMLLAWFVALPDSARSCCQALYRALLQYNVLLTGHAHACLVDIAVMILLLCHFCSQKWLHGPVVAAACRGDAQCPHRLQALTSSLQG